MLNPAHLCNFFFFYSCFWGNLNITEQNPQNFCYKTAGFKRGRGKSYSPYLEECCYHSQQHCSIFKSNTVCTVSPTGVNRSARRMINSYVSEVR